MPDNTTLVCKKCRVARRFTYWSISGKGGKNLHKCLTCGDPMRIMLGKTPAKNDRKGWESLEDNGYGLVNRE